MTQESEALSEEDQHIPAMFFFTGLCLLSLLLGWILEQWTSTHTYIIWAIFAVSYISGGRYPVVDALETIKEKRFDVNILMVLAALGAAVLGEVLEGALLMFLFSLSSALEAFAMGRTRKSVRALIGLQADTARVLQNDGQYKDVELVAIKKGQQIKIHADERVPLDGIVLAGESHVDESTLTGEPLPVFKSDRDKVYAGTTNQDGVLEIRVERESGDTSLARITRIVREARENKAKSQNFTDRVVGQYYAYAVVVLTALTFAVGFFFVNEDFSETLYRALTFMVVASPCALVISIPAAILSALATAARNGVLFKGGVYLEKLVKTRVLAVDKTGTLTTGKPGLIRTCVVDEKAVLQHAGNSQLSPTEVLLQLAAALEQHSTHPLAKAICEKNLQALPDISEFKSLTGAGLEAKVNGDLLRIGKKNLFKSMPEAFVNEVRQFEEKGQSVVYLGRESIIGYFVIADSVRPEARDTIQKLRSAGYEKIILLTGDNKHTAQRLGKDLRVDEVYAELLPEDKLKAINDLREKYGPVLMLGDGVNDAPALAKADVGMAMGGAENDVAVESADIILVKDEIKKIPSIVQLARKTRNIVYQNLIFAFAVMLTLVLWTLFVKADMPWGVVGHEGSTLLVVVNGLRLLFFRFRYSPV